MPSFPEFTRREVALRGSSYDSLWIILHDVVYDVTKFAHMHPGGEEIMMEYAGSDATGVFEDCGHSVRARITVDEYKIGELVAHERSTKQSQHIAGAKKLSCPMHVIA